MTLLAPLTGETRLFIVRADEELMALIELESATRHSRHLTKRPWLPGRGRMIGAAGVFVGRRLPTSVQR